MGGNLLIFNEISSTSRKALLLRLAVASFPTKRGGMDTLVTIDYAYLVPLMTETSVLRTLMSMALLDRKDTWAAV